MKSRDRRSGLVLWDRHIVWGFGHGALMAWPEWVKQLIAFSWNRTACLFYGHSLIGLDELKGIDYDECMHCCKRIPVSATHQQGGHQ